jgi:hypothetical protein
LQKPLRTLNQLAEFEPTRQPILLAFKPRHFNLPVHENPDRGDRLHLPWRVVMGLAMLHVDHADQIAPAMIGTEKPRTSLPAGLEEFKPRIT